MNKKQINKEFVPVRHKLTFENVRKLISRTLGLPKKFITYNSIYNGEICIASMYLLDNFLRALAEQPCAFQSLVLRVIAVEMDAAYDDNIRSCEYIWVVNTVGGKIVRVPTKVISKNAWKYFAAFRSQEEAIQAVKLLKEVKDFYA